MKTTALIAALSLLLLAGCDDSDDPPGAAPTPTSTSVATATSTSVATATATPALTATGPQAPTATATETETPEPPTATRTITRTPTITLTPSLTPTLGAGANVSFFGVLRADNTLIDQVQFDDEGRPVYVRPQGSGFVLVVEARRGTSNVAAGASTFDHDPTDPALRPDLQITASRPLGNGSTTVCDDRLPTFGGVPALDPPELDDSQETADALNDFGCRFVDGAGEHRGRPQSGACILGLDGEYDFAVSLSQIQYCALISVPLSFPPGDTILTARVRDQQGVLGPPRQIVLRVGL